MATTPKGITGVVAVSEDSGITLLGRIVWFSVPDEAISLRAFKKALGVNGVPMELAPKDTKAINTFKRAMRVHEGRVRNNGHYLDTDVAVVQETSEDCIYQISRLTRDLDEKVVEYAKLIRVIFNKRTEELAFNILPDGRNQRATCLDMQNAIEDYMEKNGGKITGAKVRGAVRTYIRSEYDEHRGIDGLSGENLRGKAGGIYFVPERFANEVRALSDMLQELYKGRAYLHAVPLADGKGERAIVLAHHTANVHEEMRELLGELRGLTSPDRERSPRSDVIANKWAQFRALQRRAAKYKDIIQDEGVELDIMNSQAKRFLDKL